MTINWRRAVTAGVLGSLAFSAVGLWVTPLIVVLRSNPVDWLAADLGGNLALAWAAHLAIGAGWAVIYAFVAARLPGPPAVRGALFALAPCLVALLMSAMSGMLAGPMAIGSLFGHVAYGIVMGAVYGPVPPPAIPKIH
jgi:hypothetical protein